MIRILLFEDDKDTRESLQFIFNSFEDLEVSGTFENGQYALKHIDASNPDVVLMDLDMPIKNGIDTLIEIRQQHKLLPVVMLTALENDDKICQAIVAGANGYLLKNQSIAHLADGVREAFHGGTPMSPTIGKKVWNMLKSGNSQEVLAFQEYHLTEREKEVLKALMGGASYKIISDKLNISFSTVHSHLKNIYKKFGVNSMGEAVSMAQRHRVV